MVLSVDSLGMNIDNESLRLKKRQTQHALFKDVEALHALALTFILTNTDECSVNQPSCSLKG